MKELILRKWDTKDIQALVHGANDPLIAANMRNSFPCPYTLENAKWFVNDCIVNDGNRRIIRAIETDGKAVGNICIFLQDDVYEKTAELSYWISVDYWGKGIATQAVKMICKEAFTVFDIVRIYAVPFDHNTASKCVLKKAGFTYEGTMRNGIYKNGKVQSCCIYSILKDSNNVITNCKS